MRKRIVAVIWLIAIACAQPAQESLGDPALDAGRNTFNRLCATCHGGDGQGGSAPSLAGVLTTFSDCTDQQRWILLGSRKWEEEVGPTYGDTDKEITTVMPAFESVLSAEEIAQVAAFQRLQFGGASIEDALTSCRL